MENSFKMQCVAVKDSNLTLLKVYAEDGVSVSVPKSYRETLTEGYVFECSLHVSKDGRFYVAEGLGKPKADAKAESKEQRAKALAKYFNKD